jgi:hypothetical protein
MVKNMPKNWKRPVPIERNALALKQMVASDLKSDATWRAKLNKVGEVAETVEEKAEPKCSPGGTSVCQQTRRIRSLVSRNVW